MKKNGLIWIICGLMVIASCTGEMDNSVYQQKEIELKNFSNTGCKPGTRAYGSDGSYFELEATKGNMLYVKHVNALFNCASNKFEASWVAIYRDYQLGAYYSSCCQIMKPHKAIIKVASKLACRTYAVLKTKTKYELA